jgi:hypothetical protein
MLRPTKESTGESSDPASVADGSRNVRNRKSRERGKRRSQPRKQFTRLLVVDDSKTGLMGNCSIMEKVDRPLLSFRRDEGRSPCRLSKRAYLVRDVC